MIKIKNIGLFILLCIFVSNLQASQIFNQFANITVRNGLSHGAVNDILQDRQGFMWFATNNGLNMYDGKSFKIYRRSPGDTNSLEANYITKIFEDSLDNLWVGTNTGLNIFDVKRNNIKRIKLGEELFITGIIQIDSDRVAVSTYNGLFIFDIHSHKYKRYLLDFTHLNRFRVMLNYQGNLLVFAEGGAYIFDIEHLDFELFIGEDNGFRGDDVRAALILNETLWMGCTDNGLYFIDLHAEGKLELFDYDLINGSTIYSVFEISNSEIVLGCENRGLLIFNPEKRYEEKREIRQIQNEYNLPNGLINKSVYTIYRDIQSNLWFGTFNGISCHYGMGMNFGAYTSQVNNSNSLINNMVNAIIEVDDYLWIGTENGISILDYSRGKVIKHINHDEESDNSLLASAVLTMEPDTDGNIWVGSWAGGIDIFDRKGKIVEKINAIGSDRRISNNSVMEITRDTAGNMWVGTMGGGVNLFLKDSKEVLHYKTNYNKKGSLDNNWIKSIMVTSKNEVWVSTHVGLELFDRKKQSFVHFIHSENDTNSIAANGVICMKEDYLGNLWFGTPSGLSRFNRADSSFINYYAATHGFSNNHILSIEQDVVGNLWIGCHSGLSKLVAGSYLSNKPVFENYDNRDGIISDEFIRRASHKTKDNKLCFGTRNGLVVFDPLRIVNNNYKPKVYITDIYINNKKLAANDKNAIIEQSARFVNNIQLKHNQSHISFEFAALNFVVPGKNQYKYKLLGFDNQWVDYDGSRATYTNIPPGTYTFMVIAANNSGLWNTEGANVLIDIAPPWHRTKLAFIGYLILIFLLIFSYRHFIIRQTQLESQLKLEIYEKDNLNKVTQMKTKFFTNISHEFLTPLSLIISPLETLINNNEHLEKSVKPIYRNAKRLQRLINQMLDISKIEADHLELRVRKGNIEAFSHEIFVSFKSMATSKNINFTYSASLNKKTVYFDSDKIEKILYNLLSNALKFTAEGGKVQTNLYNCNNEICIQVSDNGIGIGIDDKHKIFDSFYRSENVKNSSINGTGVGLSLVKGLINVYGGNIELESEIGKGTVITVSLPYKKEQFDAAVISDINTPHAITLDIIEDYSTNSKEEQTAENDNLKPNILLVEDNEELNQHMVAILSKHFNVSSASNGQQGLIMANESIPDLIITDVVMPIMSGVDLLKHIRAKELTSHIPVVMLTAKVDTESKIEGLESGADAYITKPFEQKHLESVIKNLVKSREALKDHYKKNIVVEPTQLNITSVDEKFIEKALSIAEKNLSNPDFTVEVLASEIGMSRVQLHRKLTGLLGMSASNFIREIKIKRAAELLLKGQLTVSEVMYEVNIKSRAYFTKCFKETFGMLPTDYVKANQNKS